MYANLRGPTARREAQLASKFVKRGHEDWICHSSPFTAPSLILDDVTFVIVLAKS